jgi:hypothetical protein
MEIPKDFKELLELFGAHKVEYLIVPTSSPQKNAGKKKGFGGP